MKLVPTLVICSSMVITQASAQVSPYNPAILANPPIFVPKYQPKAENKSSDKTLDYVVMWGAIAILVAAAVASRKSPADDRPTWTSKPRENTIWLPAETRKVEPPPPPAPAISPFYQ